MRLLNRVPILLQDSVPPLSERQILRALKLPHVACVADVPERGVREAVIKAARRASQQRSFAAIFRSFPVERTTANAVVVHGSETLLRSASLLRLLEGAREVTLMAITMGEAWDAVLDELSARDEPAEAWFLDSIGTLMADRAARLVENRVASDMARSGLERTRRYRPGYGDFALETQAELCALVEAHRIGLRVNEASALLPRKSITGVIGWRERREEVDLARYGTETADGAAEGDLG